MSAEISKLSQKQGDDGRKPTRGTMPSETPLNSKELSVGKLGCKPKQGKNALGDGNKKHWMWMLKHSLEFRKKFTQVIWLALCCFSLGLVCAQRGPALLDLQLLTGTDVQQASSFLTASAAGLVSGSLVAGPVYDLWSKSLPLLVLMPLMALLSVLLPFCARYWPMLLLSFLLFFCGGGVSIICNAEVLRSWEGKGQVALQAIYFSFALGGVVAPLITQPFLYPTGLQSATANSSAQPDVWNDTGNVLTTSFFGNSSPQSLMSDNLGTVPAVNRKATEEQVGYSVAVLGMVTVAPVSLTTVSFNLRSLTTVLSSEEPAPETQIHFAFIISGAITLVTSLPLLVNYARKVSERRQLRQARDRDAAASAGQDEEETKALKTKTAVQKAPSSRRTSELPLTTYLGVMLWLCAFCMLYVGVEGTFPSYISAYTVLQLGWTKTQGALLTSVFWVAFAAARFAAIFAVRALSAVRLVLASFCLLVLSLLAFLLASLYGLHWAVWGSCALCGVAFCSISPAVLSWVDQELFPVTGRVTSAVMLSANAGPLLNPLILGHLMKNDGAIWLAYIMLGEAIVCVLTFVLLLCFTRHYIQVKYCSNISAVSYDIPDGVTLDARQTAPMVSTFLLAPE